ncbi:MAG: hypothetical protein Q8O13_01450 [Candidatus Omnitrophota bacterium]|nr:hypothetical protein [Candidatus Omnitrophota bacterium]
MRIKIAKKRYLYLILEKCHCLDENPDISEAWKGSDEDLEKLKRSNMTCYDSVELPYPLSHMRFFACREDSSFAAFFQLFSRDNSVFHGLSKVLDEEFNKANKSFFPTTDDGTGYIIDKKGNIRTCILDGCNVGLRDIGIGCNGARTREFKDERHFVRSLTELENTANIYLHSCYATLINAGRLKLPETIVYLNP